MSEERNRKHGTKLLMGLLMLSFGVAAQAQEPGHLNVKTVVQKEQVDVDENGNSETRLVPAETVIPGDNVTVGVSPYDLTRGLITYRFK